MFSAETLKKPEFTSSEVVAMLADVTVPDAKDAIDQEKLFQWHRRGLIPGESVGRGNHRLYSFADILYVALFAHLNRKLTFQGRIRDLLIGGLYEKLLQVAL
jgi:DNA-binding transcriptional MerR regulator